MAKLLQTLIPLLSSIALLLAVAITAQSQTTSFAYDFYGGQPTTLTYQDAAHFPSDTTYLRLTATRPDGTPYMNSVGRVLHSESVLFKDAGGAQADFETTVKFIIRPNNGVPADGLAFFIAPVGSRIPESSFGGNLAIFGWIGDAPNVFAVEIDILANEDWDPSYRHLGIDIGSRISSNVTQIGDAVIGQEVTARIGYVAATKMITARLVAGSETYEVSYVYDLGNLLNDRVQVGLSSSTGVFAAVHDVISWYFTSTIVNTGAAAEKEAIHIQQVV